MRWFVLLVRSLGPAGATSNARVELEMAEQRRVQVAIVVQRVDAIDTFAGRSDVTWLTEPAAVRHAA